MEPAPAPFWKRIALENSGDEVFGGRPEGLTITTASEKVNEGHFGLYWHVKIVDCTVIQGW